jgi:hypothetical protein
MKKKDTGLTDKKCVKIFTGDALGIETSRKEPTVDLSEFAGTYNIDEVQEVIKKIKKKLKQAKNKK